MNFLIENWMLVAVAAASALALFLPTITKGAAGGVEPTEAVLLINREKAVLIDVCEPAEYAQGHAMGSKNIPLGQLESQLPLLVKNKSLPVILVCQVGGRASRAASQAKKLGYERAQALSGGLKAWREASLPVEKA
ncbi:MAG: rhodanese-like domain-containing protein [Burkholderiales bacterium]|nr:rhodanese-like domain-containing protein [Burkholderiales bacterium]